MILIRLGKVLISSIGTTIFVSVALSALVWFLGPFVGFGESHPLESVLSRIVTIALILFLSVSIVLLIILRQTKREKRMEDDIVESIEYRSDDGEEIVKAEFSELKNKLKQAIVALRKSKIGRKSLYELPWYVMIGPPGAGKTTAITKSGLNFPLISSSGDKISLGGVGGTRNCDWWFTNEAIIIDTAGRYTTQDSNEHQDNEGWLGFLSLLKRNRLRQPINGAVLAVSLLDLSLDDSATQKNHAIAIRKRLNELHEKLGVRFPVYVLFTKSDLIAGFSEFFDNLGKEDREQVWGFTLPFSSNVKEDQSLVTSFDEEFGLLLEQLNSQSLERMQQETDHQRRALIASFPSQMASVRATAREFLAEVFQENRFEKRHLFRGVYFTSGTQEGTPIDRLMVGMARTFGIGRQAIGSGRGRGRSFFLTRVFEDIIFPESGLVSADQKVERLYRWFNYAAIVSTLIFGLAITTLWVRSYLSNEALVDSITESVEDYRIASTQIPRGPVEDSDISNIVPALNILRNMPANPTDGAIKPDRSMTFGLYQGKTLGNQAAQIYRRALNQFLLPRLLLRLETQLQANVNNVDFLYESLKVYLMLGQQGPVNKRLIKDLLKLDWALAFPGQERQEMRADLMKHLDILLSAPMDKISLNGPLVEQIQEILSEIPVAQRVYSSIINSARSKALPRWRLTDIGGPAIARVIVRSSGKPLNEGIEGIFTYRGFNEVFLDEALEVSQRFQRESSFLGPRGKSEQTEAALLNMSRDVLDLYYLDYVSQYEKILGDIDIIPMASLSQAVEVTNVLSGPTSPLINILMSISDETKLTEERTANISAAGLAQGAQEIGTIELESSLSSRGQLFLDALANGIGAEDAEKASQMPGTFVEDRFGWLHQLIEEKDGQPSQLKELMGRLTEVYQELNKLSFVDGLVAEDATALVRFQEFANRLSGPIKRWSFQIANGSSGITGDENRASINAKWQAQVLPFCTQALERRFPFSRNARADVALSDFIRIFKPKGLIDNFVNQHLFEYIDMRTRPWTWKSVNGTDLGISQSVLQKLQYASEIRDAFFATGEQLGVNFQITPEELDSKARKVVLEIDGQKVEFSRSTTPKPSAINWPSGVGSASILLKPTKRDTVNDLTSAGPWAWFRLLSAAEIRRTNISDRTRVFFNVGGRIAIFQLQSGSFINPFTLKALDKFSCPKSF